MATDPLKERVTTRAVLKRHLAGLVGRDSRLAPVLEAAGEVPLRWGPGGFAGLATIVVAQQVSVASARAVTGRLEALLGSVTAARFLAAENAALRGCGLSAGKVRTLCGVAAAELDGRLDYDALSELGVEDAVAALSGLHGIGTWSAEIYLLFHLGHPDIFPAGDLALQKMLGLALQLEGKPDEKTSRGIASAWSPYRGAAARLLWRWFAVLKAREGVAA